MIKKSEILDNRFAFSKDEEILVNALDLCNMLIENEHLKRQVTRLSYENDIVRTRLAIRELEAPVYQRINLKA